MSELYELEPLPRAPDLPGTVIVRGTVDEVVDAVGADLLVHAMNCVRAFGDFHLALSGGRTPEPLYRRLMYDPMYRDFPWARTHVWMVDERRVPFDDERSNFGMIHALIGDHSGVPPEQVHPIFAQAGDADERYEAALRETLAWREPGQDRLDFVLLGMGEDGHTASLFPRSPALRLALSDGGRDRLVLVNEGEGVVPPGRVTMTPRLLNSARFLAVMVTGATKRAALSRAARGGAARRLPEDVLEVPIRCLRPVGGELRWYLDREACAG